MDNARDSNNIFKSLDLFFVNTLGLPVNSGMIFHVILLVLLFILAISATLHSSGQIIELHSFYCCTFSYRYMGCIRIHLFQSYSSGCCRCIVWYIAGKNRYILNITLTSVMVMLIGYSANAIIVIRSSANTPLNENNPSNPYNLLYFLNREQYGQRPLFKGPYYNAPVLEYKDGKARYSFVNGKYKVTSHDLERVYDERFMTLFPRMWSDQSDHEQVYKEWSKMKGVPVQVTDQNGKKKIVRKPTFIENLRFMISYQIRLYVFQVFHVELLGQTE